MPHNPRVDPSLTKAHLWFYRGGSLAEPPSYIIVRLGGLLYLGEMMLFSFCYPIFAIKGRIGGISPQDDGCGRKGGLEDTSNNQSMILHVWRDSVCKGSQRMASHGKKVIRIVKGRL